MSAWPGLSLVTFFTTPFTSSTAITSCQFSQSLFWIHIPMGLPSVTPCLTPDLISARSFSIFIRPPRPYPFCRRARSTLMYSSPTAIPAGTPSIMIESPCPWDSPLVRNLILLIYLPSLLAPP